MKNKKEFKSIEGIEALVKLGERQGVVAECARDYIRTVFNRYKVSVIVENFDTDIPLVQKASLVINGKSEPCIGCGMISGEIPTTNIASSLMSSRFLIDTPVIYVNSKCLVASPTNFSFAPAIAVSPKTAKKLITAKNAKASLQVKKEKTKASFLLVGNTINPQTIIFSHYDSLGPGAIDNASGTAVAIATALRCFKEGVLKETLFVFDGNEEISYDYPTYWGHGYRVFEERYQKLLDDAKRIVVVDCVGNGDNVFVQDEKILKLAFPLQKISQIKNKTFLLSADFDDLMTVYHSEKDIAKRVSLKSLVQAEEMLLKKICKKV